MRQKEGILYLNLSFIKKSNFCTKVNLFIANNGPTSNAYFVILSFNKIKTKPTMPVTRFKLEISVIGSNCSAHCT